MLLTRTKILKLIHFKNMKIKYLVSLIFIISLATLGSVYLSDKVFAQDSGLANIQYPVAELGGCKNETDCRAYCDKPDNMEACLDFAQKNNLMSDEEIQKAKNFIEAGSKGPGGCVGQDSCEAYCNDISHIDECVFYAEKNNLMSLKELEEARKVKAAIDRGVKPPACNNKKECDAYCEDAGHMEECISFGVEAGFIQGKELEGAQKMLAAIKKGIKPPPCKGKDACDEYCSNPDNMETCMNFAMEAGFMSEEEKANSQKMLQAIKKGVKPPPCKGKEACDEYCSSAEHMQECIDFSVASGMMTQEEAQMAKKTGGKGPGGCVGKEECDAFCNNPDNQETCFNFAKDNGMIPEKELKRMEEGREKFQQTVSQMPQEVADCLGAKVGTEVLEKIKSGQFVPSREIGDTMQECFQIMGNQQQPGQPGEGGMIPPAGQTGPGGCKTPEECQKYCESNPEQCKNSGSGEQQFAPGTGPNNIQGQPCEGENCRYGPPPQEQMPPCDGPNCQYGPPPIGQQPPPSSEPGGGGSMTPGEQVPLMQPTGQQPPPSENPPVSPSEPGPTSFFYNPDSFVASVAIALFNLLFGGK